MINYEKWQELLANSFEEFVVTLGAYMPSLIGAVILVAIGFIIAWVSKWLIIRVSKGLDRLARKIGIGTRYLQLRWPLSVIIASVVYWLIILFFITAAAESLGLPGFAEWLGDLIAYLPSLFVAVLILIIGYAIGALVRDKVTVAASSANILHADALGAFAKAIIILLAIVMGLKQIGIEVALIEYLLVIITTAALAAFALAFGLGAGQTVANIIALRYIRKHYQIGQRIRIDGQEGVILELSNTSVILDADVGRIMIPAKLFEERASIILVQENPDDS